MPENWRCSLGLSTGVARSRGLEPEKILGVTGMLKREERIKVGMHVIRAGSLALVALLAGCVALQPVENGQTGNPSSVLAVDFDLRLLDSVAKPVELTRFQREPTGLYTPGGFKVDYYSPTLDSASSECQAISDLKDLAIFAGGQVDEVKAARHPTFRNVEDIHGYKYVLANYPDWDNYRDGIIPDDFADIHIHIALVRYPSVDEPKQLGDFISDYAEPCNRAQSAGTVSRTLAGDEFRTFRTYNFLGLTSDLENDAGNFYFIWQDSSRYSSSDRPDITGDEVFFGVNSMIGVYSGDLLFLAYYDFWDDDEMHLGIKTEQIDAAIYSILEDLDRVG